jgi:hypothetical protein
MLRRPPLRAVLATSAAAALLVGGANLASYAATHHGHGASAKSSAAKTLVFHLGKPGKVMNGDTFHLFNAKVPKGTYSVSMSGIIAPAGGDPTDNISCVVGDKKVLVHLFNGSGVGKSGNGLYLIEGQTQSVPPGETGFIDQTNPAATVTRTKLLVGCVLNGPDKFQVVRPMVFTFTPVRTKTLKPGAAYTPPPTKLHDLTRALR